MSQNVKTVRIDDRIVQTKLSDISVLSNFVLLEELHLTNNAISDVTPLSSLINLRILEISLNPFENGDISSWGALTNLEKLNLRQTGVSDISVVANFTKLTYLNLHSNTGVTTIEPLKDLINLETLILRSIDVGDDIIYLRNLTSLCIL